MGQQLHLIEGDVFDVTPALVAAATFVKTGTFDLVYDRGSLVTVPEDARSEYAKVLSSLVRPGGRVLLVVLDYDQAQVPIDEQGLKLKPPPYSISSEEVRHLFPAGEWLIEVLERREEDLHGVPVAEIGYLLT